jgi:L-proline amide hydrolase
MRRYAAEEAPMTTSLGRTEGFIPFRGFRTWYRVVGADADGKLPLLVLHGGPGAAHDYLEPLEGFAADGRRVIFYDQLGCGRSDHPHDPSLWGVQLFKDELATVRRALGLERVHILGNSWGGMLAMEHALDGAPGIASLVLHSAPASMPLWVAETGRLRAGTTSDPEYEQAMMVFYGRHLCRLDPWPECALRTFEQLMADPEVYHTMNGPSEFHVVGRLKDWDVTARLGEIRVPTLVISGRHDECTPTVAEAVHRGIPGSSWVLLESASHLAHLEEPDRFRALVADFLATVEAAR